MTAQIEIPKAKIAEFCKRHLIRKLSLFGSVLRDDFRPDSDIDILVEFEDGAKVGLFDVAAMELELSDVMGRKVDIRTPAELSRYFRDDVLNRAELQYVH